MLSTKIFYKMKMGVSEIGTSIVTHRYVPVHETEHIFFCVNEYQHKWLQPLEGETLYVCAKRTNAKIYRIYKAGSRIGHETEQKAFEHFLFLKRKQFQHLTRDLKIVKNLLDSLEGKKFEQLGEGWTAPDSVALINSIFRFD